MTYDLGDWRKKGAVTTGKKKTAPSSVHAHDSTAASVASPSTTPFQSAPSSTMKEIILFNPFIPVRFLCQPEAFAPLCGLGDNASLTKEILNGGKSLPLVTGITGYRRHQITKRHGGDLGKCLLGFGGGFHSGVFV